MTGSLAYRKNEDAIRRGEVPAKYTRLLPHITGQRILEIGSAEGVLALLLAKIGKEVTAVEKSEERHAAAQNLYAEWLARENKFKAPKFVNGSIADNLNLMTGKDCLIAVRCIYYLGEDLDRIFEIAAKHIPSVVLCGNRNRADRWRAGTPDAPLGEMNAYAASEGMTALLTRHGYRIVAEVEEGDEIIAGRMDV